MQLVQRRRVLVMCLVAQNIKYNYISVAVYKGSNGKMD